MLKLKNVSCFYEKNKFIDNVSLSISKGDFFCLVGINGSGKTTLLKSILNIVNYTGDIFLENKNIKDIHIKNLAKKIAFMEQIKTINFPYKVEDIVFFARYPYQKGLFKSLTKKDIEICHKALNDVGLLEKKDKALNEISGGEQQRVFIAQVFAQNPDVLVLDEPTNFLDIKYKIEILSLIKKWSKENNKTIICSLHDLDFALKYPNKAGLIHKGKLIKQGTPQEVIFSDEMEKSYEVNLKEFFS